MKKIKARIKNILVIVVFLLMIISIASSALFALAEEIFDQPPDQDNGILEKDNISAPIQRDDKPQLPPQEEFNKPPEKDFAPPQEEIFDQPPEQNNIFPEKENAIRRIQPADKQYMPSVAPNQADDRQYQPPPSKRPDNEQYQPQPNLIQPRDKQYMPLPPEYNKSPEENFLPPPEESKMPEPGYNQEGKTPQPCLEKGILDQAECQKLMEKLFPPRAASLLMKTPWPCQEKGVTDEAECAKIMGEFNRPAMFKEKIGENENYDQFFEEKILDKVFDQGLPEPCQAKNIMDPQECFKFMESFKRDMMNKERNQRREGDYGMFGPPFMEFGPAGEAYRPEDFDPSGTGFGVGNIPPGMEGGPPNMQAGLPKECSDAGATDSESCKKIMMEAHMPPECKQAGANTEEACKKVMFKQNMPPYCQKAGAETPEECEKLMIKKFSPPPCQEAGAETPEECEAIMKKMHLPPECKQAGITDPEKCEEYLDRLYAPKICQDKKAFTKAACEKVVFDAYGRPDACQGLTDAKCRFLIETGQIESDIEQKLNKSLPQKCIDLGAKTMEECRRISEKKNIPQECQDAGAFTRQACEKVMFEKYNKIDEQTAKEMFPKPCLEAGALDPNSCEEIMSSHYMPKECKEANITNGEECKNLMDKIHLPLECKQAGATSRQDCEDILRSKFMAPECRESGITDKNACEKFMFDKYARRTVTCEGIADDQCQLSIQKRHLGQIIEKEKKAEKFKKIIDPLIGKHIDFKKLTPPAPEETEAAEQEASPAGVESQTAEEELTMNDIIPLAAEESTSLMIIPAVEATVVKEDEEIINTLPAVIMFDDDKDGLANDMEERFGTNPTNADSDGDGFNDGIEVKANYNPLGTTGEFSGLIADLTPIDTVVLSQKSIEQPVTAGEVFEELTIAETEILSPAPLSEETMPTESEGGTTSLIPMARAAENNAGVTLRGQAPAETVLTLFIYSEIALVATVKSDDLGRWEYTISEPLADGKHEVYLAINDENGKISKKSNPLSFFIKEAKAVTVEDFLKPEVVIDSNQNAAQTAKNYYLWGLIMACVFVASAAGVWFVKRKKAK